jgi:hypothetical protein
MTMQINVSRIEDNPRDTGNGPTGWKRLVYRVDLGDRVFDTFFTGPELDPASGMETGLVLALLPAMRLRRTIHVNGKISSSFVSGVLDYMTVIARHFPEFSPVSITADTYVQASPARLRRAASFFSGGADSFFSLIKGRNDITDVVFIHGFDMSIKALERRAVIVEKITRAAGEMGVRLIEVETNLTDIIRNYGDWLRHGHGLGMVAVSRVLSGEFTEIRIPGTYSIDQQEPWGSWLATDPLFSDERLQVTHDTCIATRSDKLRLIARHPVALKYLRVCSEKKAGNLYNCCRCEKCLRTMTSLHALHALEDASSFPLPLTPELVAGVLLPRRGLRIFPRENLVMYKDHRPEAKDYIAALKTQLRRSVWWSLTRLKWRKRLARWSRYLPRNRVT